MKKILQMIKLLFDKLYKKQHTEKFPIIMKGNTLIYYSEKQYDTAEDAIKAAEPIIFNDDSDKLSKGEYMGTFILKKDQTYLKSGIQFDKNIPVEKIDEIFAKSSININDGKPHKVWMDDKSNEILVDGKKMETAEK